MFTRKEKEEVKDLLISIDYESGQAEINPIQEINHERILARGLSVPIGDTRAFTGKRGRIFVVNAPSEATADYKRIADLEVSTVLKQITRYKDRPEDHRVDVKFYVVLAAFIITAVILAFRIGG